MRTLSQFLIFICLSISVILQPFASAACLKTVAEALEERGLISRPVKGLYQSIPDAKSIHLEKKYENVIMELGPNEFSSVLTDETTGSIVGTMERKYDPDKNELIFIGGSLNPNVKSFMNCEGCIPLIEDRGTPTVVLVNLQLLRYKGLVYGSLKQAQSSVSNSESMMQFLFSPDVIQWIKLNKNLNEMPEKMLYNAMIGTQSVRYLSTILIQSGHEITTTTFKATWKKLNLVSVPAKWINKMKEVFGDDISNLVVPLAVNVRFSLRAAKP